MTQDHAILEQFMDLFILENIEGNQLSKQILSENMPEAVQISLEPYVYEDVPLIKNMQQYVVEKANVNQTQESTFEEEVRSYFNDMLMPCLNEGSLHWSKQDMSEKWNNYTLHEKKRMMDFVTVFHGICNYLDKREARLQTKIR